MTNTIKTTIPVSYSLTNPLKKAIVEIDFNEWIEKNDRYFANTSDYWLSEITEMQKTYDINGNETGEEEVTYEVRTLISSRTVEVSVEQLNAITAALAPYTENMTGHDARNLLKKQGALMFVKSDFLEDENNENTGLTKYNTIPDNWIIKD